mmetsp:Transcript_34392/g.57743  ORF Transcript_34392/g.57743 Transcript_34392/m.57743 type:complete len:236 (+) Transcript_34392:1957-2664(+)
MDLMLEEVVVQVALKALAKLDFRRHPSDGVHELELGPRDQGLRILGSEVHLDNLLPVVVDVNTAVRVNEHLVLRVGLLIRRDKLAHETPDRKVIHEKFIPIMVPDGVLELLHGLLVQDIAADNPLLDFHAEFEVHLAVNQLVPFQHLAETAPLVHGFLRLGLAEGKLVVVVCLLRIVVRTYLVHPKCDGIANRIPVIVLVRLNEPGKENATECTRSRPCQHWPRGPPASACHKAN